MLPISLSYVFYAGLGGALGSIARYLAGNWVQSLSKSYQFPFGTLAVNLIGCFIIGLLAHLVEARHIFSPEVRVLIFVGILGGFTTFSAFANDSLILLQAGIFPVLINLSTNVILGIALVWLGQALGAHLWG